MLPLQVYRFDPSTGQVQVVADQFVHPNWIAFATDGKAAFVSDTGSAGGFLGQPLPTTIVLYSYQYDVDPKTRSFANHCVFAYSDSGISDGIQLDTRDNVYLGVGKGYTYGTPRALSPGNSLLTPKLIFTNSSLLIFNDQKIYLANTTVGGVDLSAH